MSRHAEFKPDTPQDKIDRLIPQADALRKLADDDPKKAPLAGLIDQINALRAIQAGALTPDERAVRESLKNAQLE